ncbi:HU family DNA-binding protein [Microbispora rosea]|uniref:HU family DNA-binding protein n=1 Tax=Microbispora rosea TaxID=58117 RepID=UPI0004C321AE|nr:HU family DNA-binding protein [Microbispora rosea]
MNKPELATAIAEAHNLSKATALDIVNTMCGAIVAATAAGDTVALHGFGTFERVHKPARTARNPQTGDPVEVAAKDVPVFKPAGAFKTAVNGRVPADA